MDSVFFLILRRMRLPLLLLITSYAIAIGGLVMMPGQDDQGRPWQFDFLHAFYFVSYTASTIGFGEIPYPFTPAQRLWTSFSIYLTVLAWLYAFGNILALIQDTTFQRVLARRRFEYRVRQQATDFFLVCGFGETGSLVVSLLDGRGIGATVIDHDAAAISALELEPAFGHCPGMVGDARDPDCLRRAGLDHPRCLGVLALTGDDDVNVAVTLAAMLLRPGARLFCQARAERVEGRLPTSHSAVILDPDRSFAVALALAIHQPETYRLHDLLGYLPGTPVPPVVRPPRGHWLLCGHGRFGRAVENSLRGEGISLSIIDTNPAALEEGGVLGPATDAAVLQEAGITDAVGIVAGTDVDITNLGILLNARALKPEIFTVLRQNQDINRPLVHAAGPDLLMETSLIVVRQLAIDLTSPLLRLFLLHAMDEPPAWAAALADTLCALDEARVPEIFTRTLDGADAPGLMRRVTRGQDSFVHGLLGPAGPEDAALAGVILMRERGGQYTLLPAPDDVLEAGDRLLFAGAPGVTARIDARLWSDDFPGWDMPRKTAPNSRPHPNLPA